MGLDAVVYRNREHLEMGSDNARANMAQQTGKVYFEDNQLSLRTINCRESTSTKSKLSRIGSVTWQRSAPFARRLQG